MSSILRTLVVSIVACAAVLPCPAHALTDYQRTQITQHLDSPKLAEDHDIFDGKQFNEATPLDTASQYYKAYLKELNFAVRAWNMLSSSDRGSEEALALHDKLQAKTDWGQAMRMAYPTYSAAAQAKPQAEAQKPSPPAAATAPAAPASASPDTTPNRTSEPPAAADAPAVAVDTPTKANPAKPDETTWKAACQAFQEQAMTPRNREPMTRLILQELEGNARIGEPASVNQHAEIAQAVSTVCASTDLAMLTAKPCWYVLHRPTNDPVQWCKTAAQAPELIRQATINHAKSVIGSVGSATIQSVEEFKASEGWLTFEGPVAFDKRFALESSGNQRVVENMRKLLSSAGIENTEETLWGEQAKRLNELKQAVMDTASTWPLPEDAGESYATGLAEKQVMKTHPDASIKKSLINRSNYQIHKNALGVPDRRTLPGYILFQLPGEPFCQLRSFTLTEQHSGGGNYEPASGVRIGYVRFQRCD